MPMQLKLHQPVYLIRWTGLWSFTRQDQHVFNLEHFKVSGGLAFFPSPCSETSIPLSLIFGVYKNLTYYLHIKTKTLCTTFKEKWGKSKYSILQTPFLKPFGILVLKQFLFWLYPQNWVGASFLKILCQVWHVWFTNMNLLKMHQQGFYRVF